MTLTTLRRRAPLLLALANLALLALYPVAWAAPLARAGVLPFFSGSELTIIDGIGDLWAADKPLAILVALFALAAPYGKTLALAAIQFGLISGPRWAGGLEWLGKLSMADVFLLALYIVLIKGVGIGHVETAWGLWLFTGLVLCSLAIAMATRRAARQDQKRER